MLSVIDLNARTTSLISGDVHAIDKLDLKTVGLMERNPGITINSVDGNQHYTFAMNTTVPPFDDNNVRLALKHAIDRQALVDKILFGYGTVGNDHPIGRGQRFYNEGLEQTSYDPEKAKEYLKAAGLDSLTVELAAADAAFPGAVDAAILFQNSAAAAGITIDVARKPNDGYWADVWMKHPFSAVYWAGARPRTRCSRPPMPRARPGTTPFGPTSGSTSFWSRRGPSSTRRSGANSITRCRRS